METEVERTGRAKAVLVCERGGSETAAIATVVVHVGGDQAGAGVRFGGLVEFETGTRQHLLDIVIPVAFNVCAGLGVPTGPLEMAVTNPGAVSASDLQAEVRGFSADLPVFLAVLSAHLGSPVPEGLVCTGQIVSPDGDIAMVSGMSAKLAAAQADPAIQQFVLPDIDRDASLAALTPRELQRVAGAVASAKERLRVDFAGDVGDLVRAVFDDTDVVLAALRRDYFERPLAPENATNGIGKAVRFLIEQGRAGFWSALEHALLGGSNSVVKELLLERVRYQVRKAVYPAGLGSRLLQVLQSLPPATRRLKLEFPLLPLKECTELCQFAAESEYEDVVLLHEAVWGGNLARQAVCRATDQVGPQTGDAGETILETILSAISATALAERVDRPIDTARVSFLLDTVTVCSTEEFLEVVTAYGLHLLQHAGMVMDPVVTDAARAAALDLLEKAFPGRQGFNAALAEARNPTPRGGLRFVLDTLTERFKKDQRAKHTQRVLVETLGGLERSRRVAFIKALRKRLAMDQSPASDLGDPERFAEYCEELALAYVESLDHFRGFLRKY
jgi:hypothetical protein